MELVTIRQFSDQSDALLAQGCLSASGIESFLTDANIARLEWPLSRGMRLQVRADDAETAIALLTPRPILAEPLAEPTEEA